MKLHEQLIRGFLKQQQQLAWWTDLLGSTSILNLIKMQNQTATGTYTSSAAVSTANMTGHNKWLVSQEGGFHSFATYSHRFAILCLASLKISVVASVGIGGCSANSMRPGDCLLHWTFRSIYDSP